ncbi:cAMP-dependent protein kinase inhibitor gamma isoform X1 [Anser cygnoides]|nr:cAMP-dependent protein kinase inhibitor gamma isoform X1 [Anser cygnoides]
MSKKCSKVSCSRRCHEETCRNWSDTDSLCSYCEARLEVEQKPDTSLRILDVHRNSMEVESSTYTDFISCDRAGRRNAVHDIQRDATTISMRKLTEDISDLTVEGADSEAPSTSSESDPGARPKEQENKPSP